MNKISSVQRSCFYVILAVFFANFNSAQDDYSDGSGSESLSQEFLFPKNRPGILMTRIIGGTLTSNHQYPFQVALIIWFGTEKYFCGGTLISRWWVLTAAHCIEGVELAEVTLGAYDLSSTESVQTTMNSTTFIIHELWNSDTLQNDVGLIKLPQRAAFSSYISTITIANGTQTYADETGLVIGWGLTSLGTMSSMLRHVNTTVMANEACAEVDPYQTVIIDSHICTSGDGIVGSCSGDSGGPLLVNGIQVGVVSFGYSSCTAGKPSVYARLTDYYQWIWKNALEDNDSDDYDDNIIVNDDSSPANKCQAILFHLSIIALALLLQN